MKIGSVPYLNARPLVDWLERNPPPGITLTYAIPSVLVQQLLSGELDIAMASTFPTLQRNDLHLLPGLGVTATGPAWSVRLFSRVPLRKCARWRLTPPQIHQCAGAHHHGRSVWCDSRILAPGAGY